MNKDSDVDVSVIVNNSKYLQVLQELQSKYRYSMTPNFEFTGYSVEELKTGKLSSYGKKNENWDSQIRKINSNDKTDLW